MKKFEQLSEAHRQTLIDIQKSIPTEWTQSVTVRESIAPASEEIMRLALDDPEVDEETKQQFRFVIDSGFFDQKIDVEQEIVAELIDAYVDKEVAKAIIAKKLPKTKKKVSFEAIYKRYTNALQTYERSKPKSN
jgi:hypothetical protein